MKDLPYFKFYPSEWLTGEICLESFEAQGKYLALCCVYWSKQGQITEEQARRRVGAEIDLFIEIGVLKIDGANVKISFLDEQLQERNKLCKQNAANVKKRYSKTPASQEIPTGVEIRSTDTSTVVYNIEEKREEESRKEKKREEKKITLPYQEESFANAWMDWKEYKKKEHRFSYKSEESELATLKKLSSECTARGGGAEMAIEAIYYYIAGGWKGIYFEEKKKQPHTHDIDSVMAWAKNNS